MSLQWRSHQQQIASRKSERPDAKDGFQRAFCSSLDQAEAKVDAEMRWLSRNRHTLIEAFIVEVQDITGKIKDKK